MAKNKYRLQPVLDVRDRAKQEAAQRVAARRAQVAEAEAELERRERAVEECRARQREAQEKLAEELQGGVQARHIHSWRAHVSDLRQQEKELLGRVDQQRAVVARAEKDLENALAGLVEASKELQVMEKHRAEWKRQTRRAEERREQKLSDEIGAVIYRRQRQEEAGEEEEAAGGDAEQ